MTWAVVGVSWVTSFLVSFGIGWWFRRREVDLKRQGRYWRTEAHREAELVNEAGAFIAVIAVTGIRPGEEQHFQERARVLYDKVRVARMEGLL